MNKVSKSIYKSRKKTSYCIVLMFWPKQMYDRIPHLTLEEETAKNRLSFPPVLAMDKNPKTSTNHQIQTHFCWGHTIKRSIMSLTTWIPQCTVSLGALWSTSAHTAVPSSSVVARALQSSWVHQVHCLSYGSYHRNTDPAGNRRSFVCTIHSVIISGFHLACYFASQEHNSWTVSKQAPTADTSHQVRAWAGRRWGCYFYITLSKFQ